MKNKTKFEEKIIKTVYRYEEKKILAIVIKYLSVIIISLILLIVSGKILIEILQTQQSLDLLQILSEDPETIRIYALDTFTTFYLELPREETITTLVLFIIFLCTVILLAKNFQRVKTKLVAIMKYNKQNKN